MTDDVFWDLIGLIAAEAADGQAAIEPVVNALASMDVDGITAFDDALAGKLFALDTRRHAEQWATDSPPFSADGFLYARCWVVARGRDHYEHVMNDPAAMPPDRPEFEFEDLHYVPEYAFKRKTGGDYTYLPTPSPETFSNADGWPGLEHGAFYLPRNQPPDADSPGGIA
jgi:Protein of unknown function (DUF4240)